MDRGVWRATVHRIAQSRTLLKWLSMHTRFLCVISCFNSSFLFSTDAAWKKSYDKPRQCIKKQRDHFANKGLYSESFSSSHVQMWELDHKEGWAPKNLCFLTVVLEKILENPLDSMEIKSLILIGKQPWLFIGRTDVEAESPLLWPPDVKSRLTRKYPDTWKDIIQEEKGMTEDEMFRWNHQLNGHEYEQAPGDGYI